MFVARKLTIKFIFKLKFYAKRLFSGVSPQYDLTTFFNLKTLNGLSFLNHFYYQVKS